MKKIKNLLLLIGIGCISLVLIWYIMQFIYSLFNTSSISDYVVHNEVIPALTTVLLMVSPVLLLVRNLKNKTGRVLPIICIVISGIILPILLFSYLTPTISKYIIYSKLGVLDTYVTTFIAFFKSGGILFLIGLILVLVGSILSLFKQKEKQA